MASLNDVKAVLDSDPNRAAVRTLPTPSGIVSSTVYRDIDGYYVVASPDDHHRECWSQWENAVACVGSWAEAEDWRIQVREGKEQLLTLRYVAKRLNVSEDTVRRWAKQGILDAVPLPNLGKHQSYRVRRSVLNDLLRGSTRQELAS